MAKTRPGALILLVEDCQDNLDMYSAYLERKSLSTAEAQEGKTAIALARELRPDLIVVDLTLPDMDGREVIEALRRETLTKRIPVIVVSGQPEPHQSGPWDAFLSKPCPPSLLLEHIQRLIRKT